MERLSETVRGEAARFGAVGVLGDLAERWPGEVGTAIARNAWPSRLARDGTLHVNTADSVWAFELSQRAGEIAERLGVERVRFAPGPLATTAPVPSLDPLPSPTPAELEEAARIAAPLSDENLRETIEKAACLSLARSRSGRPL
jgi:hypothetical protein